MSDTYRDRAPEIPNLEFAFSAVAWGPIVAGAAAALATSVVLLTLGSGLGLTAVSPWSGESASAASLGIGGRHRDDL
jgi:hypothetical protein